MKQMAVRSISSLLFLVCFVRTVESLAAQNIGRRDAISKASSATLAVLSPKPADAVPPPIALDTVGESINENKRVASSTPDIPPPTLSLTIPSTSTMIKIPRVGYSFYKTTPEKAERCAALALRYGVKHLDVATQYESNSEIGKAIQTYVKYGRTKLALEEKPELVSLMDAACEYETRRTKYEGKKRGRERRREELFLSHKLSNKEQSSDPGQIREAIFKTLNELGVNYLDMVSIHSPLTNKETRLATYRALLDLQRGDASTKSLPVIRAVGVCNYGLGPLKEIADAGLPLPAVNQLELSPFNTHQDVVDWCRQNGVAVSCAAWSKLSGANGPADQWAILSQIASSKGVTKAQVLVQWSLQKGYICVPRSGSGSKIERVAIAENSYGGGQTIRNGKMVTDNNGSDQMSLTISEMKTIDDLNLDYKAGKLGRTDGWADSDITDATWDPTDVA